MDNEEGINILIKRAYIERIVDKCLYRMKGKNPNEFICHRDSNCVDWCSYGNKFTKLTPKDCEYFKRLK